MFGKEKNVLFLEKFHFLKKFIFWKIAFFLKKIHQNMEDYHGKSPSKFVKIEFNWGDSCIKNVSRHIFATWVYFMHI